jgi:hypothetical protein
MAEARPPYSYEEARALVPSVRSILIQLAVDKRRFDEAVDRLGLLIAPGADGSGPGRLEQQEAEVQQIGEGIKALAAHLEGLGIELRDLEAGLVDIPTVRDGQPAWFCWRLEDPELGYWHTTREGFTSRRPL